MNAFAKVDKETFYRFAAEHADQRFEYVRGRIVQQMTGGTKRHGLVVGRIKRLIEDQMDAGDWATIADRGVDTTPTIRYPDIVVEAADEAPDDSLSTKRPVLIVEVLSPSTMQADLDEKPKEYLAIPSLEAYLVASQTEPALRIWTRKRGKGFPVEPLEVEGRMEAVAIKTKSLDLVLPLSVIYQGIG